MAEDTWTLILQLGGPTPEHESVQKEMDKDFICFFNIVDLVEKYNYSSIDYIYYKRREDSGTATLVGIENDDDVRRMLIEHESENKVRLCVMKEKACMDNRVSITAVKSSREIARSESNGPKEACTVIFRNETLKTYKNSQARAEILNALRNRREQEMGQCSLSNVGSEQHSDNPGILDTNNTNPQTDWPTHARRCRTQLEDMDQARKKGRGTLKGYKVAKKRFDNASQKLPIEFSTRLGGPIGINYRSFIEEVVLFMKRKAPIIGVRKWKDIHDDVKNSIAIDVLAKWDLADTRSTRKKIWDIARERYRGWRSNLHATYQAYNNDGLRFKNKPEDLDILEWEYLIHYFGTDKKFQEISQKNSENRKKQKTQHVTGAKSFSQTSYEKRDKETGEEPNMLDLWKATHMKDDKWSNTAAKDVYENAHKKIADREEKIGNPVSVEEQNNVFQESYRASTNCKTSQARGQGYMAKAVTGPESLHAQIDEQAHVTAETQQKNNELFCEVSELKAKLAAQQEESDRKLEAERNERLRLELKIQEEQCKERQVLREEMIAMLMGQTAPSTEQSDPSVQVPSENAELHDKTKKARSIENSAVMRALFHQNTINQGTTSNNTQRTISSHDLRKAAKNYGRSRTDQDKII